MSSDGVTDDSKLETCVAFSWRERAEVVAGVPAAPLLMRTFLIFVSTSLAQLRTFSVLRFSASVPQLVLTGHDSL